MNLKLTLKYVIFALVATILNLLVQYAILNFYEGYASLYIAIFIGTLVGLSVKYILDKKFIFFYQTISSGQNLGKFILYSAMGVVTTFIFWFFELSFNYLFDFASAKFIGAVIGLAIGYFIKYNLDKKFVFIKNSQLNE